jgi:NAD(P)-dependent dehydrogenase (short-subunit alcohol dehydrogenase family)
MRLSEKRALVTGAASGNGRAMAVRFAQEGADIVVADVDDRGAEETASMVREYGRRAVITHTDVRSSADCREAVEAAVREFGGLDIVVANAGVGAGGPFLTLSEEDWDRVIDVNLKGVFLTCQAAARRMVEQGNGGRIITIASIMAEMGAAGSAGYCASKGGVKLLTKSMAIALAPYNITVNAIGPGYIETNMTEPGFRNFPERKAWLVDRTPQERIGKPEDVAALATFLASDEAGFMTGSISFTDGGFTAGQYSREMRLQQEALLQQQAQTAR